MKLRIPLPKQIEKPFKVKKRYSRTRDKKMVEKHGHDEKEKIHY